MAITVPRSAVTGLRLGLLLTLGMAGACAKRVPNEQDFRSGALSLADEAWAQRATEGYGPSEQAIDALVKVDPDWPDARWRAARLAVEQGEAAADSREALRAFSIAREHAVRCLAGSATRSTSTRELAPLLERMPKGSEVCVPWLALAWAKAYLTVGPQAAAIDLDDLDIVCAFPAPDPTGEQAWATGLVMAGRPLRDGRDLAAARRAFDEALRRGSSDLTRYADALEWIAWPEQDEAYERRLRRGLERRAAEPSPADLAALERVLAHDAQAADASQPATSEDPAGAE